MRIAQTAKFADFLIWIHININHRHMAAYVVQKSTIPLHPIQQVQFNHSFKIV